MLPLDSKHKMSCLEVVMRFLANERIDGSATLTKAFKCAPLCTACNIAANNSPKGITLLYDPW